ncbi:hypothetical protein P9E76_06985 [Schinkia azotoformans]|uniref:hypothetical protein n=1 Tax=Schinkia azotoformans TaxID=1454 RepID=UPI0002E53B3C|nr:hypothetical protein [Schinkia azotoformans]MEC1637892.1 hypothetical protein [Schinkia azotoformans]MEC1944788.1 hypothetical protein [Schinkia azotoformans]MED4352049.1 hypothetical protein [Schinkia azotoformans]
MKIFVYVMMIIIFLYTAGFSVTLWKEKSKVGSIVVFTLALVVVIAPFFTIIK